MATAAGETPGYLEAQLVSKAKEFPKCALKCWAEHANKLGCAANNMWCINNKHTFQSMEKLFDCTPKPCNYSSMYQETITPPPPIYLLYRLPGNLDIY